MDGVFNTLQAAPPPTITGNNGEADVETSLGVGCRIMEAAASAATQPQPSSNNSWDESYPRWKRVLGSNENKLIWKAINWKGNIDVNKQENPCDEQFNEHIENLLNPKILENNTNSDMRTLYTRLKCLIYE